MGGNDDTEPKYLRLTPSDASLISDLTAALNRFSNLFETMGNPAQKILDGGTKMTEAAGSIASSTAKLGDIESSRAQSTQREEAAAGQMAMASTTMAEAGQAMWNAAVRQSGY